MTNISKLVLAAALLTAGIASPAFAQSFDPEAGTGNVVPFSLTPPAAKGDRMAVRDVAPGKVAARRSGLNAFAMVPSASPARDANGPALTGGGSAGYNQNLYNY